MYRSNINLIYSGKTTATKQFIKPRKQNQKAKQEDILQERLGEDNTSTAEISESQEKVLPCIEEADDINEEVEQQVQPELLTKVQKKT